MKCYAREFVIMDFKLIVFSVMLEEFPRYVLAIFKIFIIKTNC